MTTSPRPVIAHISVVGPIGAGKSTLLERAEAAPKEFLAALAALPEFAWLAAWPPTTRLAFAHEEPDRWRNVDGDLLLPLMYAAPKKHAFEFQATVLAERMRAARIAVIEAQSSDIPTHLLLLTDGSVHTDSGVFARACYDAGFMSIDRWLLYRNRYDVCTRDLDVAWTPGGTLYLCTPVDETATRIKQRGRECEQSLPASYLADIAKRHAALLADPDYPAQPVVQIRDTPRDDECPFLPVGRK